jgi:hypothetical protein
LFVIEAIPSLSVAVAGGTVTNASHEERSVEIIMLAGQVISGAWLSFTITVKLHVVVLPLASVTVYVTTVVPTGYVPEASLVPVKSFITVAIAQLSFVVGIAIVKFAEENPASATVVMLLGQVIVGTVVSVGITENVQVEVLPASSVAVSVTTVVHVITVPAAGD